MNGQATLDFFHRFYRPTVSGLPKFLRLREALVSAIEEGYWERGTKLPPEQAIAQATPFSLGTVQKALKALVDEGILIRRQGHGTFVNHGRQQMDSPWHLRFYNDDRSSFVPVFSHVLTRERIAEKGPWSGYLNKKASNIICIVRRFDVNHEFNVYSKFYISVEKAGTIMTRPLSELEITNFKRVLQQECRLPITHISQTVRLVRFPSEACAVIGVKDGTAGILLRALASVGKNNPLYYQELFIPPNNRELCISETYKSTVASNAEGVDVA